MNPDTMTRDQLIAHIRTVAKDWGIKTPDCSKSTDQALRKLVRKLFRDGERLAQ